MDKKKKKKEKRRTLSSKNICKIIELVLLPFLIGVATFCANSYYDKKVENKEQREQRNEMISGLKLGLSEDYLNLKLGLPMYSIKEEALNFSGESRSLTHNFYNTDGTLVRISLDENKIIAFFFFQITDVPTLELSFYDVSKVNLGKYTYKDIKTTSQSEFKDSKTGESIYRPTSIIKTSLANSNAHQFYSEWYSFGKATSYSTIVYGNIYNKEDFDYFVKKMNDTSSENINEVEIIQYANKKMVDKKIASNSKQYFSISNVEQADKFKNEVHEEYNNAKPNVYGIVNTSYTEYIEINSPAKDWLSIYDSWNYK